MNVFILHSFFPDLSITALLWTGCPCYTAIYFNGQVFFLVLTGWGFVCWLCVVRKESENTPSIQFFVSPPPPPASPSSSASLLSPPPSFSKESKIPPVFYWFSPASGSSNHKIAFFYVTEREREGWGRSYPITGRAFYYFLSDPPLPLPPSPSPPAARRNYGWGGITIFIRSRLIS